MVSETKNNNPLAEVFLTIFESETIARQLKNVVNVASVPQRSPFRYPGGKTWLIPTIRKWLKQTMSPNSSNPLLAEELSV